MNARLFWLIAVDHCAGNAGSPIHKRWKGKKKKQTNPKLFLSFFHLRYMETPRYNFTISSLFYSITLHVPNTFAQYSTYLTSYQVLCKIACILANVTKWLKSLDILHWSYQSGYTLAQLVKHRSLWSQMKKRPYFFFFFSRVELIWGN